METKIFEVRDRMTMIIVVCTSVKDDSLDLRVNTMKWRCGYTPHSDYIMMYRLASPESGCSHDPHFWDNRTMKEAHKQIRRDWNELKSGDLIDVQFFLGETEEREISEF